MRSYEEMLEFSQESFMETYASANRMRQLSNGCQTVPVIMDSRSNAKQSKYRTINFGTPGEDDLKNNNKRGKKKEEKTGRASSGFKKNLSGQNQRSSTKMSQDSSVSSRLRKISVDKLSSLSGAMQAAMNRRRKSVATDQPGRNLLDRKTERKQSLVSFTSSPLVAIKSRSIGSGSTDDDDFYRDTARVSSSSSPSNCSSVPNSPGGSIVHQGYLEYRNKKKRWEKYWCSMREGGIHCYLSPQHENPRDVILLRGYDVVADVKNLNRVRFIFHLQQQGFPNLYFSSENYRDYLLWVGCLEREILSINASLSNPRSSTLRSEDSYFITEHQKKQLMFRKQRASLPNIHAPVSKRRDTLNLLPEVPNENGTQDSVTLQKQKLLNELAQQKKQLLEEQQLLNRLPPSPRLQAVINRQDSLPECCDAQELEQQNTPIELRTNKLKHLLEHRRSSCQSLQVPLISLGLSPFRTPKRRENDVELMDAKVKMRELQETLDLIKKELNKEDNDKQLSSDIERRQQEIEFLIRKEQNNVEEILKARYESNSRLQRRRSYDAAVTSSSLNRDILQANSSKSSLASNQGSGNLGVPTSSSNTLDYSPGRMSGRFYGDDIDDEDDITTDEDSGFQASNERLGGESDHPYSSSIIASGKLEEPEKNPSRRSPSQPIPISPQKSVLYPKSSAGQDDEIDSSILAKIEDFELFAKRKLQETGKQT